MPIINLKESVWDVGYQNLYATMLYPNNKYLRESHYYRNYTKDMINALYLEKETVEVTTELLNRLLNSPSDKEMEKSGDEAVMKGMLSGRILSKIHYMTVNNSTEPSLKKAIYICSQENKNSEIPSSEPTIRKYWEEYKSVSHFWYADQIVRANEDIDLSEIEDYQKIRKYEYEGNTPLTNTELNHLIRGHMISSLSEKFRKFGEGFISSRNKDRKPLLDKKSNWKIENGKDYLDIELKVPTSTKLENTISKYSKRYTY